MKSKSTSAQHVSLRSGLQTGLVSLGDLLKVNTGFGELEKATTRRALATCWLRSPEDFAFEAIVQQVVAPVGITDGQVKALKAWTQCARIITSILDGTQAVAEGQQAGVERLVAMKVVKNHKDFGLEVALPLLDAVQALEFFSQLTMWQDGGNDQKRDIIMPWHLNGYYTERNAQDDQGRSSSYTSLMGLSNVMKLTDIDAMGRVMGEAAAAFSNLTRLPGPVRVLGAMTPRPQIDITEAARGGRWLELTDFAVGASVVMKYRIQVKSGSMSIYRAIPAVEINRKVVQEAVDVNFRGMPGLVNVGELPALMGQCRHLSLFVQRPEIAERYPILTQWAGQTGAPLLILGNANSTPTGKAWFAELGKELNAARHERDELMAEIKMTQDAEHKRKLDAIENEGKDQQVLEAMGLVEKPVVETPVVEEEEPVNKHATGGLESYWPQDEAGTDEQQGVEEAPEPAAADMDIHVEDITLHPEEPITKKGKPKSEDKKKKKVRAKAAHLES